MKMVADEKRARRGQLNTMDRLSDLPDSIIHHIISFLGTEEACRTTILSKRWVHIWSTGLILEFRPRFFVAKKDGVFVDGYVSSVKGPYDTETIERFVNFIEITMQRYSEKNLSIRKLTLEYPTNDQEMFGMIDGWLGIALRNQVEVLSLSVIPKGLPSYGLPAILFLAKSLINVTFCRVRVPYCEILKLTSLQSLDMTKVNIDENMLQEIIMSCPLKILRLYKCSGPQNISIPCCSRLESLNVTRTIPIGGTVLVDTSSLKRCSYFGYREDEPLPIILTPASKKNLRDLQIYGVVIMIDIFDKLVSELPSIENIAFFGCTMPKNIRISSQTLKELGVHDCYDLINVVIDAPELDTFCYNGDLQLSSVINCQSKYNAYLHLNIAKLDNRALVRIKNLLRKSKCCKVMSIILNDAHDVPEIEVDMDRLSKIRQYRDEPCYVQELKLSVSCTTSTSTSILEESTCRALIDGLLWCCRPDILSLSITIPYDNNIIRTLLEILQNKVEYWKHPLKRMEIEGTNCSLLFSSWDLDLRLRLYW